MPLAYLGLGGNLGDPVHNLLQAIEQFRQDPDTVVVAISPLYQSVAIGPSGQPDYANAVVCIKTEHAPEALLNFCQRIEHVLGRKRRERWGARTVDIDLLLFDELIISTDRLQVPHPEITMRNFVLRPLLDIAPNCRIPLHGLAKQLSAAADDSGLQLHPDLRWPVQSA